MAIDKLVCVFLAFTQNAVDSSSEEYLALMESMKPGIALQSQHQYLVDDYVDQNGQIIRPKDDQFITSKKELIRSIEAGENVLASGRQDFPYSSEAEVRAQLAERKKALSEIQKAQDGQAAKFCEHLGM